MAQKRKATTDLQHPAFERNVEEDDETTSRSKRSNDNRVSSSSVYDFPTSQPLRLVNNPSSAARKDSGTNISGIRQSLPHHTVGSRTSTANHTLTSENGVDSDESDSDTSISFDESTQRSTRFLKEISQVNRRFSKWIQESVERDPTALLTRTFVDHQRHVQKIFDAERQLNMTDLQKMRLDRQEKVLHLLRETEPLASGFRHGGTPTPQAKENIDLLRPKANTLNPFLSNNTPTVYPKCPETIVRNQETSKDSPFSRKPTTNSFNDAGNTPANATKPSWGNSTFKTPFSTPTSEPPSFGSSDNNDSKMRTNPFFASPATPSDAGKKIDPLFVNPFLSNAARPGSTPTTSSFGSKPAAVTFDGGAPPTTLNNGNHDEVKQSTFLNPTANGGTASGAAPSNFQGFSFASAVSQALVKKQSDAATEDDAEDEDSPPKVVFTPVGEEGSVYTKRCKVFYKKETGSAYEDRGVANLYLKPVANTTKTQLIARADNALGTLLINVLLSPDLPAVKLLPNNVMLSCVPTPGSGKRVVLIRVKTEADADEVIGKLEEYS